MKHSQNVFGFLLSGIVLLASCTRVNPVRTEPGEMAAEKKEVVLTGIGSWYGGEFHGRKTANGEIYDMFKLTAAHQTFPFNTLVEVENLENQKKIVVRINDRGPFVKSRVIDLSLRAARMLEMEEKGTAVVALRIIKPGDLPGKGIGYASSDGYCLQAGAYADPENARRMLRKLTDDIGQVKFEIHFSDGYHKIISEKIPDRPEAERLLRLLDEYGIDVFIRDFD